MVVEFTDMKKQNDSVAYEIDNLWPLLDFIEHFNIHYALLLKRYERYKIINNKYNVDFIDSVTYFDMIIVQLRAMCIEARYRDKNYTAQNLLKLIGKSEQADTIDAMLNEPFPLSLENEITIRDSLKLLADKIICHYDNFDGKKDLDWCFAQIVETQLKNPYRKVNLDYIMKTLMDCIGGKLAL